MCEVNLDGLRPFDQWELLLDCNGHGPFSVVCEVALTQNEFIPLYHVDSRRRWKPRWVLHTYVYKYISTKLHLSIFRHKMDRVWTLLDMHGMLWLEMVATLCFFFQAYPSSSWHQSLARLRISFPNTQLTFPSSPCSMPGGKSGVVCVQHHIGMFYALRHIPLVGGLLWISSHF